MKKTILGLALALGCSVSGASFKDGNSLYSDCTSQQSVERLACVAYVQGAVDMGNEVLFCPPASMTGKQAVDTIVDFLKSNPSIRHHGADMIALHLFKKLYPCKEATPTASRQAI